MDTPTDIKTDGIALESKVQNDISAIVAKAMNPTIVDRIKTLWTIIKSKWPLFALFLFLAWVYQGIPAVKVEPTGEVSGGWPFSDVLFALLAVVAVPLLASLIHALAFESAANYSASGALKADVPTPGISNAYIHWAFTQAISWLVAFGVIYMLHH